MIESVFSLLVIGFGVAEIGKMNRLKVAEEMPYGVYLSAGMLGDVLLPTRYKPQGCKVGDLVDAFLYYDSDDTLVATTQVPPIEVGKFGYIKCVSVADPGAFLGWGLQKDLFVPHSEQRVPMEEGRSYIVYAYLDERSNRIVATTKVERFLDREPPSYKPGQEVDLLIAEQTDIGQKAIVDSAHWGVLYHDELFRHLHYGERVSGYIKKVRPDGKIDLTLHKPGYAKVDPLREKILTMLAAEGGQLEVSDKSPPEQIYRMFGVSKKAFKMALGALYRERRIVIEKGAINTVTEDDGGE